MGSRRCLLKPLIPTGGCGDGSKHHGAFCLVDPPKVPGATWSRSLLLSGSLLARFAAPLCYNFLHVIRMNEYLRDGQVCRLCPCLGMAWGGVPRVDESGVSKCSRRKAGGLPPHLQQMVFIAKMGSAFQDVPILGQSFNTWFPLLLVVYVLLLTFNLWEQCASKFFISDAVRFDVVGLEYAFPREMVQGGMRLWERSMA